MKALSSIPRGDRNQKIKIKYHGESIEFPINLDYLTFKSRIDLDSFQYVEKDEIGNFNRFPTINDLLADGTATLSRYVDEASVIYKTWPDKISYNEIKRKFRKEGFRVSDEAIKHNFDAWKQDMKSGFVDKENGYHLFTPCGHNPLQFHATRLDKHFEDWQITYEC
jgi:hypothetical protein